MSDTAWKPKRAVDGIQHSTMTAFTVELSIQCAETKKALEEVVAENEQFQIKDSTDTTGPALLILELQDNHEETFSIIRDLTKVARGTEIFLTASKLDSAILLEAMRAGAKEYLAQPIQKQEVEEAFSRFQERAVSAAEANDVVVLAGKGHESTQSFVDRVVPFDDREVARELLCAAGWEGGCRAGA